MTDQCRDCRYFDTDMNPESGPGVGVCHRYPKRPINTGDEPVHGRIAPKSTYVHFWPEMAAEDWCGEFEAREAPASDPKAARPAGAAVQLPRVPRKPATSPLRVDAPKPELPVSGDDAA